MVLDLECLDRMYLNAYIPNLQVSGQVATFMTRSPGMSDRLPGDHGEDGGPVPRPRCDAFAEGNDIPILHFKKDDRQIDVMPPCCRAAARGPGVVAVGVAQEFQSGLHRPPEARLGIRRPRSFTFDKADRRVTVYYFYVQRRRLRARASSRSVR